MEKVKRLKEIFERESIEAILYQRMTNFLRNVLEQKDRLNIYLAFQDQMVLVILKK